MEPMNDIKVIPQVFYDVIARIIPGTVAILALMSASNRKLQDVITILFNGSTELTNSTFVLILTLLVLAFLLGHFISALSDFFLLRWILTKPLRSFFKILQDTLNELCNDNLEKRVSQLIEDTVGSSTPTQEEVTQKPHKEKSKRVEPEVAAFYLWYDRVRVLNPDVGSRLAKLRAEYHMRERIAQALLIALLLHILLFIFTSRKPPELIVSWNWYFFFFSIGGYLIARIATVKACKTLQRSVISHFFLLNNIPLIAQAGDSKPKTRALWVKLAALKRDPKLFSQGSGGKLKGRKILVTELYTHTEKEATELEWEPPTDSGKCPIQIMKDTEIAVFTNHTLQDCHYHKRGTEIYTVLKGKMRIEIEQQDILLLAGDMIVVNPGTSHEVKPDGSEFICQVIIVNCAGKADKYVRANRERAAP